jgi:hypothetical protein
MNKLFNKLAKGAELTGTLSGKLLGKFVVNFPEATDAIKNLAHGKTAEALKSMAQAGATILKQGATLTSKPFALDAAELKAEALEQKASLKTAFMSAGKTAFNKEVAKPRPKSAPNMALKT